MTPRAMAISFRIWAHCDPIGWECTMRECADALGLRLASVRAVASAKGWSTRFRAGADHWQYGGGGDVHFRTTAQDAALSGEWL